MMKYIKKRGSKFHYVRRVPKEVRDIDNRDFVQIALNTDSPSLAQQRTVALNHKIEDYWQSILIDQHDQEDRFKQTVRAALKPEQVYQRPNDTSPSVEALLQQLIDMRQPNVHKPTKATTKPLKHKNARYRKHWSVSGRSTKISYWINQMGRLGNGKTHALALSKT